MNYIGVHTTHYTCVHKRLHYALHNILLRSKNARFARRSGKGMRRIGKGNPATEGRVNATNQCGGMDSAMGHAPLARCEGCLGSLLARPDKGHAPLARLWPSYGLAKGRAPLARIARLPTNGWSFIERLPTNGEVFALENTESEPTRHCRRGGGERETKICEFFYNFF